MYMSQSFPQWFHFIKLWYNIQKRRLRLEPSVHMGAYVTHHMLILRTITTIRIEKRSITTKISFVLPLTVTQAPNIFNP